jgi:hypothetical protein
LLWQVSYGYHDDRKKQSFAAHGFVAVERQVEFMLDKSSLENV